MFKKIFLVMLICVFIAPVYAESTRYVNDEIVITLRAGQGDEYRILRTLKSGVSMTVLEEQPVFSQVRLKDGTEGWVRNQYIVSEPIARLKLLVVSDELTTLRKNYEKVSKSLGQITAERDSLLTARKDLEKQNLHLAQQNDELEAIAARPMEIEQHNHELVGENQRLVAENRQTNDENESLRNSSVQKWFLVGAGVLLFGLVAGLVLPKLGNRRSSSW